MYKSVNDLPDGIKNNLPKKAQHVYLRSFGNWTKKGADNRTAHLKAWAEVKQRFELSSNGWSEIK